MMQYELEEGFEKRGMKVIIIWLGKCCTKNTHISVLDRLINNIKLCTYISSLLDTCQKRLIAAEINFI